MSAWFFWRKSADPVFEDPRFFANEEEASTLEHAAASQPPPQSPRATPLEPPPEDINAIGVREKSFPIWLAIALAALVVVLLLGAALWIKTSLPFVTTRKEEYPSVKVVTEEPVRGAPKIEITPKDAAPVPQGETTAMPRIVPAPSAAGSLDAACPLTTVLDKTTQKPVVDARGVPLLVDCHGIYKPQAAPEPVSVVPRSPVLTEASTVVPSSAASVTPVVAPDRYAGEALFTRQQVPKADSRVTSSGGPQLPVPPVGAADVLRQLELLRSPPPPAPQPIQVLPSPLASAAPVKAVGAPSTQGRPGEMLVSDKTDRTFAAKAIDENLVIPKGTQVDCGLTTRSVTEISGYASCQVVRDVYSANGRVLLIERMSTVEGEYAAQSQAGQRYIHVLWTRLRKPGGVTIDIASPATDGLGGAGIPAFVDNRWPERLAGAYMLSFIKDAIAYKTAVDAQGGQSAVGAVAYQNSIRTSESMAEQILATTIGIKPILYANQGDRVAIYVARDLDFSRIYDVRFK